MFSLQSVQSSEAVQGELSEKMERLRTELVVFKSLMPHDVSVLLYLVSTSAHNWWHANIHPQQYII